MPSIRTLSNHLLDSLPAAELEALRPRLGTVELVREAVLVEAGSPLTQIYLPHSGAIAMMVRLSEGQTVEVATIGRESVFGAAAALDGGVSLTAAVVVLPGTASVLDAADLRAAAESAASFSAPRWRDTTRRCWRWPSNPPHAMRRTRSRRAPVPLAVARARPVRRRNIATDTGVSGADDRRAA